MADPVQGPGLPSGTQLDHKNIIPNLTHFLNYRELLALRKLSKNWNDHISSLPRFRAGLKAKILDKWYKEYNETDNFESTLKWGTCEFFHFAYRGNKVSFKNYWHHAGSLLTKLTLDHCSMECDGFELFLSHCPHLETVILKRCNFRDLDDFHNQPHYHKNFPVGPQADEIRSPIRHLTFDTINKIEQCFMDYLIRRTGSLESLMISTCFVQLEPELPPMRHTNTMQKEFPPRPTMEARFDEFQQNISQLILRNVNSLRKVELHRNDFQSKLFGNWLAGQADKSFQIREIALTLLRDENNYQEVIQFLRNCKGIQKLSLKFVADVTTSAIQDMILPHKNTIQNLEILLAGNVLLKTIQLPSLVDFGKLELLKLGDSKNLDPHDVRLVNVNTRLGARFRRHQWNINNIELAKRRLHTNLSYDFLLNLPPSLKKLSLSKYITLEDFIQKLDVNSPAIVSFRKLTKLEICGPWIHSIGNVFETIIEELKQLEILSLVSCGIEDTHITGLTLTEVKELRQCITHGLIMHMDGTVPTEQEVLERINQAMNICAKAPVRPRLVDLINLKHLDLSLNGGISDVSLFNGLRIPGLLTLNLNCCYQLSDNGMEILVNNFPNLIELGLRNCSKLSRYGLNKVVNGCRKIRRINTTPAIQMREVVGFDYTVNPNFGDIVKARPREKEEYDTADPDAHVLA